MNIQIKDSDEGNYIVINLTKDEVENLVKGRYPSKDITIGDRIFTISVGVNL